MNCSDLPQWITSWSCDERLNFLHELREARRSSKVRTRRGNIVGAFCIIRLIASIVCWGLWREFISGDMQLYRSVLRLWFLLWRTITITVCVCDFWAFVVIDICIELSSSWWNACAPRVPVDVVFHMLMCFMAAALVKSTMSTVLCIMSRTTSSYVWLCGCVYKISRIFRKRHTHQVSVCHVSPRLLNWSKFRVPKSFEDRSMMLIFQMRGHIRDLGVLCEFWAKLSACVKFPGAVNVMKFNITAC